jgi:hypothetical protein
MGMATWLVLRSSTGLPWCVRNRLPSGHQTWHQKLGLVQPRFVISGTSADEAIYSSSLSTAPFRSGKIIIDQKQPEHVEHFKYLSILITNDARRTHEIKSRILVAKAAFNKNTYHQQIGLNFKEDTKGKLNLDPADPKYPWKFWNLVLGKDGDQLDRSWEKRRSIT